MKKSCVLRFFQLNLFSAKTLLSSAELEALKALFVPLRAHAARTRDRSHVCWWSFFPWGKKKKNEHLIFYFLKKHFENKIVTQKTNIFFFFKVLNKEEYFYWDEFFKRKKRNRIKNRFSYSRLFFLFFLFRLKSKKEILFGFFSKNK